MSASVVELIQAYYIFSTLQF